MKNLLLALALSSFTCMSYAAHSTLLGEEEYAALNAHLRNKKSLMACLPSTIASSVVGAFTGGLTRYIERELKIELSKDYIIFLMFMWWVEHKVRHKVINSLEQDFADSDIPYKKSFMSFSAWVSSWLAYLNM